MIHIILYIILLGILTICHLSVQYSQGYQKFQKWKKDKDEEDESYKGEAESNDGKSIGSFVCEGPEVVDNVGGIRHVHIVMNHNPQEEMTETNFTGLTSHLAFFYDLP